MNSSRFDDVTKGLTSKTSRRRAIKTLAATAIAGAFGFGGSTLVFANELWNHNQSMACK